MMPLNPYSEAETNQGNLTTNVPADLFGLSIPQPLKATPFKAKSDTLTISQKRTIDRQLILPAMPKVIRCMAQTRNDCGEFIEILTSQVGFGDRLKTDGTVGYCPDIQRRGDGVIYYETKSIGDNGAAIIYEARREKDRRFEREDRESRMLFYWFWRHRCKVQGIASVGELWEKLAASLQYAIVLPFFEVDAACELVKLRTLNKQYTGGGSELGYGDRSKGYGEGRSIPLSLLRQRCTTQTSTYATTVEGVAVPSVPVFTVDRFRFLVESPICSQLVLPF